MFRYFYEANGQTLLKVYATFGQAVDAALIDFSGGLAKPTKIQAANYMDILDYHDLHWIYSRTWGAEYDRATGKVTPRDA